MQMLTEHAWLHTLRKAAEPCEMMQSRSISPKRRPPSRARPSTGCLVRICTGPRPREWILCSPWSTPADNS